MFYDGDAPIITLLCARRHRNSGRVLNRIRVTDRAGVAPGFIF